MRDDLGHKYLLLGTTIVLQMGMDTSIVAMAPWN